jgi:hypothetical protein
MAATGNPPLAVSMVPLNFPREYTCDIGNTDIINL